MAERRGSSGRRTAASRRHDVETMEWDAAQLTAIERAERLRALGFELSAADAVARGCVFPAGLTRRNYLNAHRLDLRRWYAEAMAASDDDE